MNLAGRRIWITGASSGIGYAVALAAARAGMQVIASGRDSTKLRALQQQQANIVLILPFDVTDRSAYGPAVQQIQDKLGGLDIAFFNAGASIHMEVAQFSSAICKQLMDVNYFSLVYGIEAVLPLLRRSRAPQLVGMSSIAAYGGLPQGAAYCASKAAVKTLLEGIRIDLLPEGIPVSIVCPGFVKTPLTDRHQFALPGVISAEKAAKIILKGIARKTHEIHFPKRISLLQKFITSLPSPCFTWIMQKAIARVKRQEAARKNVSK